MYQRYRKGRLIQSEGELDPVAAAVLARDSAERGAAKAPRIVTPDDEVNREFLAMEQRGNRETLGKLEEIADEIPEAPGWIPHQVLGPLRAAHWLRFAALHARHHLAIVEDVVQGTRPLRGSVAQPREQEMLLAEPRPSRTDEMPPSDWKSSVTTPVLPCPSRSILSVDEVLQR